MTFKRLVTIICISLTFPGCGQSNPIIGKWECVNTDSQSQAAIEGLTGKAMKKRIFNIEFSEKERVDRNRRHYPAEYRIEKDKVIVYSDFGSLTKEGREYVFTDRNSFTLDLRWQGKDSCKRIK